MIVGEPGIGKTALVDAFLAQMAATEDVWIGHGQCIDHYGAGEAYLPVLEALGRLGRDAEGEHCRGRRRWANRCCSDNAPPCQRISDDLMAPSGIRCTFWVTMVLPRRTAHKALLEALEG